jgi:hypothetical protein
MCTPSIRSRTWAIQCENRDCDFNCDDFSDSYLYAYKTAKEHLEKNPTHLIAVWYTPPPRVFDRVASHSKPNVVDDSPACDRGDA